MLSTSFPPLLHSAIVLGRNGYMTMVVLQEYCGL